MSIIDNIVKKRTLQFKQLGSLWYTTQHNSECFGVQILGGKLRKQSRVMRRDLGRLENRTTTSGNCTDEWLEAEKHGVVPRPACEFQFERVSV
jgi:hypothetical protein